MSRTSQRNRRQSWLQFVGVVGLMTFGWLVVLPWMATWPVIQRHIARMEQADIAVDAMFYTELNWEPPDGAAWR